MIFRCGWWCGSLFLLIDERKGATFELNYYPNTTLFKTKAPRDFGRECEAATRYALSASSKSSAKYVTIYIPICV